MPVIKRLGFFFLFQLDADFRRVLPMMSNDDRAPVRAAVTENCEELKPQHRHNCTDDDDGERFRIKTAHIVPIRCAEKEPST